MQDILQQIIATKREELASVRAVVGDASKRCDTAPATLGDGAHYRPSLREALLASDTGIIAEFKRRSPSKGWINEAARPDVVPLSYQQNGAAALSILTDEHYFGGHDDFIRQARQSGVTLPILYKNFVIDEAQLYAAALCGASAVLLIAACLPKEKLRALMARAHELGLEVLLEMHDERELEYAELQPDLCGINNRNLGSFVTDVDNSFRLAEKLRAVVGDASKRDGSADGVAGDASRHHEDGTATHGGIAHYAPVLVSESGISDPAAVRALRAAGFRGFLIGETFMRAASPGLALKEFIDLCG